ncbi:MAG: hypothetical protein GY918_03435 [Gammaproteobacteria bacterium]|nr:hypothetical protein [Gammaproteobacteria bacterium]
MSSSNRKTGNACQVWILNRSVDPVTAIKDGQDYGICGNCPHRKQSDGSRSCYVNVGQAPLSVWKAFHAGKYVNDPGAMLSRKAVKGRKIRFGAYGDPALIDSLTFRILATACDGHTAYTHQWRESWGKWTAGFMQASCDGMADYLEASAMGFKTFAVIPKGSVNYSGKQCPATVTDSAATCVTCMLCQGDKTDIFVEAHGSGAKYIKDKTFA